jgi:predicted secreted protein
MTDLQTIQQYIILCLLGGIFIAPRRSLDYTEFKIKSINKDDDNYLDKNELVFNKYKTAKFYNEQRVAIPKELKSILTKWIKNNNSKKVDSISSIYQQDKSATGMMGVVGNEIWKFKRKETGVETLVFEYCRSFEKNSTVETKKVIVKVK